MEIRLYYEDTDSGGVVYYANYLRYLERARTEFFRDRGCEVAELMKDGFLFVVTHVDLSYHFSPQYNDILVITTQIDELRRASFVLSHQVFLKKTETLVADGKIKMACIDKTGKPKRLPREMDKVLKGC